MPTAQADSPVSLIEGIGPALEQRLQALQVFCVFDLLRAAPEQLHPALADVASLDQVRRWRAMAALLQVHGMTCQWAEALAGAGVGSLEALHGRTHADLAAILAAARTAGTIPDVPDAETLWRMQVDAAVLAFSGSLNVTVQDAAGVAVAGSRVECGTQQADSDARGRVRFARLPLGRQHRLAVTCAGYAPLEAGHVEAEADELRAAVLTLTLEARPEGEAPAARASSEYDGDELPPFDAHAFTTEARDGLVLRERDVLLLRKYYEDGKSVQLTSKFLEHRDGRFVAVSFRTPRSMLPAGVKERDHLLVRGGRLVKVAMSPARLRVLKAQRRVRGAFAGQARPQTLREHDAALREYGELLKSVLAEMPGGRRR